jgi:hypothetical protein
VPLQPVASRRSAAVTLEVALGRSKHQACPPGSGQVARNSQGAGLEQRLLLKGGEPHGPEGARSRPAPSQWSGFDAARSAGMSELRRVSPGGTSASFTRLEQSEFKSLARQRRHLYLAELHDISIRF